MITAEQVRRAAKGPVNAANLGSVIVSLDRFGKSVGLNLPHRFVPYMAQLMHESGAFRYDREVWGPTPAQARYDTRTDLGNTPAKDGDGKLYAGRTPIQLTGKGNYGAFTAWCVKMGFNAPDFVKNPDKVNTDPWEGLAPIWYWDVGNPDRKSLNRYADEGNQEMITRRINGGLNGYAERLEYYTRLGLVVLGFAPDGILAFQKKSKADGVYAGELDGDDGPKTRSAIHLALVALSATSMSLASIKAAPVVEEQEVTVAVPVTPPSMDAPWWKSKETIVPIVTASGGSIVAGVSGMPWQNLLIIIGFAAVAGGVLLWLKNRDVKAVEKTVERMS